MKNLMSYVKQDAMRTVLAIFLLLNFGTSAIGIAGQNAVPDYLLDMIKKIDVVYMYSTDEMVRFVEKQYTKVTEKPDDFYASDLEYCMDSIWPNIPDSKKTPSLVSKYKYLSNYYDEQIKVKKTNALTIKIL